MPSSGFPSWGDERVLGTVSYMSPERFDRDLVGQGFESAT